MPIREGSLDRSAIQSLVGLSATDTIAFYGATPAVQRAASIQGASVVSVSSNITVAASLTAWIVEVTATLTGLGLWKGST
ncbi:MAG: hypothetical protein JWQ87_2243 [Candidatus Sulfotelmatobacter sp.]|nr:hypothetical protein [Candidatus Sulfotelmatobacter sp.]